MENLENEIWKPINGYEGKYEVSNTGRVKSLGRYIQKSRNGKPVQQWYDGFVMKNIVDARWGYHRVYLCKDGKIKAYKLHRLVAGAFIDNPENKPCVNHKNGIKTDNRVDNLEWCSYQENARHAIDTGLQTYVYGESRASSKLTNEQAKEIKIMLNEGVKTQKEIGELFGVSHVAVSDIKRGVTWSHIAV